MIGRMSERKGKRNVGNELGGYIVNFGDWEGFELLLVVIREEEI